MIDCNEEIWEVKGEVWIKKREPDPLDMSEWIFCVVATKDLPESESISLIPFKKLYGEGIRFDEIRAEVDKLIN